MGYRQHYDYFRSSGVAAVDGDFSMVILNEGPAKEQAQSHAVLLGREEGFEDPVSLGTGNPGAIIDDFDLHTFFRAQEPGPDGNLSPRTDRPEGI